MRKKTRGIIIPPESRSGIKRLTQEQKGHLLDAIYAYNIDGEILDMDPIVGIAFDMMKDFFDHTIAEYEKTCEQNTENIKERWRKAKEKTKIKNDTTVYDGIRPNTNDTNKGNINKIKSNKYKERKDKIKLLGNELKEDNKVEIENFIENGKLGDFRKYFFRYILEKNEKGELSEKIDPDKLSKINDKIMLFYSKLGEDKARLEIENFMEYHRENKTNFANIQLRMNTWLSNKI